VRAERSQLRAEGVDAQAESSQLEDGPASGCEVVWLRGVGLRGLRGLRTKRLDATFRARLASAVAGDTSAAANKPVRRAPPTL